MTSSDSQLQVGDVAPPIVLDDQKGETVDLSSFAGRHVFVYFYPKASTPGCTTQACNLRDLRAEAPPELGDAVVIGISPDLPDKLAKFDDKHELGFTLLSDPDHAVADAYGAWGLKKLYGKEYEGVIRSAVLIAPDGTVSHRWPKLSPKQTPTALLDALAEG